MDNMSPFKQCQKASSTSSSGCSTASSSTDINKCQLKSQNNSEHGLLNNKCSSHNSDIKRSKSFLHCLGKRLGRHFIHQAHIHHHQQHQHHQGHQMNIKGTTVAYNSQEDLRSSSTDSFSLSYERNSRLDCMSPTDQTITDEQQQQQQQQQNSRTSSSSSTSSASSSSATSHFSSSLDQDDLEIPASYCYSQNHIYIETTGLNRPTSSLSHCHEEIHEIYSDIEDCSTDEEENEDEEHATKDNSKHDENKENHENCPNAQQLKVPQALKPKSVSTPNSKRNSPSCFLTLNSSCSSKGLHLSRMSITSSVKSMFQHISSVSAASTCSISCSSTPLKRVWDTKCNKKSAASAAETAAAAAAKTSGSSSASSSSSSSSGSDTSAAKSSKTAKKLTTSTQCTVPAKKAEKKQQSILRPPMSYVYMKGMSGLYSRVPRYSVCCQYGQHWA